MTTALIGFAVLLLLMLVLRVPIPFAMSLVGVLGLVFLSSPDWTDFESLKWAPYIKLAARRIITTAQNYELSVIPLFILMGNLVTKSGLSEDLYKASFRWIGHFKGGLAMATILSCGFFSAICGSSLATAATMSKVAMPSMRKYKYDESLATASIAAGGTLGILIPPSVLLVLYGLLTETSIRDLFAAGFIPGMIGILFYMLAVKYTVMRKASSGPPGDKYDWKGRVEALNGVWGIIFLFVLVLGGIYGGIFTPTEAAGIGSGGALFIALLRRSLTWKSLITILTDTAKTTTVLFSILIGSLIFTNFISRTGLPSDLVNFITELDLSNWMVIAIILLIYIVLGMVFESISMVMLTVPIFYPLVQSLGFDLVWFGIVVVVVTEISLISPPVGLNVFVISSVLPEVKTSTIFKGVIPFFVLDILRLILLATIPAISLFLPKLLYN